MGKTYRNQKGDSQKSKKNKGDHGKFKTAKKNNNNKGKFGSDDLD
jgi:hypothetical protein